MKLRATVTSKGQVTIPIEVRRRMHLEQGDVVEFSIEDGSARLKPVRSAGNPFQSFVGALGGFNDTNEVNAWVRDLRDDD